MTTPMPAAGEPVPVESPVAPGAVSEPGNDDSVRGLWWKTVAVLVVAFLATVGVLLWQWLGPASGTVTR